MARYIHSVGNIVTNIVEYPGAIAQAAVGEVITLALTGAESVGDNLTTILSYVQAAKQASLDAFLDVNFDFKAFIRAGTVTNLTGVQVGTFIANISNNYRSIRASIAAASTVAAVNAISVSSGWPSNP